MTDRRLTRRALLAGSATGLAALAGCSSTDLPVVGDDEPDLAFDPAALDGVVPADRRTRPETYVGPVPDALADRHESRARDLLSGVPADVSVPNEAVVQRLERDREGAMEDVSEGQTASGPLDRLSDWRYTRQTAAEVRGAYDAATGEVDAETLAERRRAVRSDLAGFWAPWEYRSTDIVEAVAVHHHLETIRDSCRHHLEPSVAFPETPRASVFRVGSLVGDVERARAAFEDLTGLWRAYELSTNDRTPYRDALSAGAHELDRLVMATRPQVQSYLPENVGPDAFRRDVADLPAERLFVEAKREARSWLDAMGFDRRRGAHASAIVSSGRALVAVLALSAAVNAIQSGAHGDPDSAEVVRSQRSAAVSALEQAASASPPLGPLVGTPAWQALRDGDRRLGGSSRESTGHTVDRHDVVTAVGQYAHAEYAAEAVPTVADRMADALDRATSGSPTG